MKTSSKWIALTIVLAAVMVLFSAPVYAQSPAGDVKPTFISPDPWLIRARLAGLYRILPQGVGGPASPARSFFSGRSVQTGFTRLPQLTIGVSTSILPLEDWAKMYMPVYSQVGTDIKVLSEKPSQLKDGTTTREVELEFVPKNGPKMNHFILMTRKGLTWISITLGNDKGKIGEDLKNYAYSLTFQPSREEPVKVPPDVRAFLNKWSSDLASGDVERIMSNFSDQFLNQGMKKAVQEQWFRSSPFSPDAAGVTSHEATVTVFEPQGDKAYLDGFVSRKHKDGCQRS